MTRPSRDASGRPSRDALTGSTPPPQITSGGSRHSRGCSRPSRASRPSTWVSALPGLSALPGQSFHSAAIHGDTPMDVEMGPALDVTLPDPRSISIQGIPTLPGAQPSLSGVRPPPGFTGTPRGPGNFHGRGNCQPSGRHHPSTVNDVALSGHSALPGLSALPGQSSHSAAIHGDTPFGSGNRAGPGRPPSSPALLDQLSISLPWYLSPALGPSPPSRELGHPRDSSNPYGVRGIFRVGANASHQAGTATPLWWN